MHRFLILSLLLFISCGTTYKINDVQQHEKVEQQIQNPYFNEIGKEYAYRFKITFLKNEMKGNFVVKKMDENTHRVVMMSDFGNTLFDLSLTKNDYILHYAMPDLNKKMVVRTLAEDLQTILMNQYFIEEQLLSVNQKILKSSEISLVYPIQEEIYYTELFRLKNNKIKTINVIEDDKTSSPEKIFIRHNHFNLSIELLKADSFLEE